MEIKLYKARLKTANKTDDQVKTAFEDGIGEVTQEDIDLYRESMNLVDGQEVIVTDGLLSPDGYYTLVSWQEKDDNVWREFVYIQEQDPYFGTYADEREEFLADWESGDYSPSGSLTFSKDDVEILETLNQEG
ncbi:hypothetical protein [Oceanobacillus caeni]|uniref:hypothetical protein n=1 Tax=Oceanobacillus caeni TaxID=405946 RepID=UPI000761EE66|nr:hypothetical protein [Oceanobacillus caeni]